MPAMIDAFNAMLPAIVADYLSRGFDISLHDVNAAGRTYDVISGMRTTVAPSSADYRPMDELADRKLHPSNLSLPRQIGTAPTLTAVPVSHEISWKPASPPRSPSKRFLG